jgi:predicted DNA-binding antitoxin AbrB/MazE fold protein
MTEEERKQMNALCGRIQEEKDYGKFVALLRQLSDLIERKELRFGRRANNREWQRNRPWKTIRGVVKKVLKPVHPAESEKIEISVEAADELFREIRIENMLVNVQGQPVALKDGAHVDITLEADGKETVEARGKSLTS